MAVIEFSGCESPEVIRRMLEIATAEFRLANEQGALVHAANLAKYQKSDPHPPSDQDDSQPQPSP